MCLPLTARRPPDVPIELDGGRQTLRGTCRKIRRQALPTVCVLASREGPLRRGTGRVSQGGKEGSQPSDDGTSHVTKKAL